MKTSSRTLLTTLVLLVLLSTGLAHAGRPQQELVPLNGLVHWAAGPVGPDFQPTLLVPAPAGNPTRAVFERTLRQNQRYLDPEAIPDNVQVSYSGVLSGSGDLYINDFSECMVVLDPTDPNHLLGSSKFFYVPQTYDFYTGVFESYDGGQTWTEAIPNGVRNYGLTSDPVNTFDDAGNGYFTLLTRSPTGVDMLKKPVGQYWQPPVIVDRTTNTDKQWIYGDQDPLGLSPYAGNLYMSWTSFGGPVTGIVFSRSTDGNQTWTPPISLADGDVQGSVPGVAPDGTVYVVFGRSIFYGGPGTMEYVKSVDGGVTFGPPAVAANITSIPFLLPDPFGAPHNFRSPASLPGFAVSPLDGSLHVVWSDYRHGDADIYYAHSTDSGATWSTAVRLNDDPIGNGMDQFQPQVSVAANGRVAVMWFDRRLPCPDLPWIPEAHKGVYNGCIDTFMTRSFDNGQTWGANIRASAQTWDWTLNLPLDGSQNGFIGDYQGIASSNGYDYPFWNATANLGENAENYQEIFVAIVPVTPTPDLGASAKLVTPTIALPGDVLSYTVLLRNEGLTNSVGAWMSDAVPTETSYLSGTLSASSGQAGYDPGAATITWTGDVLVNIPVTVTFAVYVPHGVPDGTRIANRAWITDGAGMQYWREVTTTISVPPYVVETRPDDGAADVSIDAVVAVTFSEAMDPDTLLIIAAPDPGSWSATWTADNTAVTLTHAPFAHSTLYTIEVAALDEEGDALEPWGAPNPWSFTTAALPPTPPTIVTAAPAAGATGVALDAPVVLHFSEAMSTTSLSVTAVPDPGGWSAVWSAGDTVATLAHAPFGYSTTYTVTVWAEDAQGETLVPGPAPNPWAFTTLPATPPVILEAQPADGAVGVPLTVTVVVTFSEAMSTASLNVSVQPDPGGWSATWAQSDTVVTLAHAPFDYDTAYTATVWAEDAQGEALVAGPVTNPWRWATASLPPFVAAAWPAAGAANVPLTVTIMVTFSEAMDTATFTLTAVPDPGGWGATWAQSDTVALLTHAPFTPGTMYSLTVWAEDTAGLALVAGPVPNPWSWTTPAQVWHVIYLPMVVR